LVDSHIYKMREKARSTKFDVIESIVQIFLHLPHVLNSSQ